MPRGLFFEISIRCQPCQTIDLGSSAGTQAQAAAHQATAATRQRRTHAQRQRGAWVTRPTKPPSYCCSCPIVALILTCDSHRQAGTTAIAATTIEAMWVTRGQSERTEHGML